MYMHHPKPDIEAKFYEELGRILEKTPWFNIEYILGDMSSKVGRKEAYKEANGVDSNHIANNDNVKRVIEFVLQNNMKIHSKYLI